MKQTVVPSERPTPETLSALPLEITGLCEQADEEMQTIQQALLSRVEGFTDQIEQLQRVASSLSGRIQTMMHSQKPLDRVVVVERFQDDGVGEGTLHRDSLYGALTLRPKSFVNANTQIAGVWIDRKLSDGIPGNNMVVKSVESSNSGIPKVTLVGETDNHAHILYAFDSGVDTWFEWEKVIIQTNQPLLEVDGCAYLYESSAEVRNVQEVTAGHGWTVSVAYPGEEQIVKGVPLAMFRQSTDGEDTAMLTLEISMTDTVSNVWFELAPYHIGGRGFRINWVRVSEDGVNWDELATNRFVSAYVGDESFVTRFYIKRARYLRIQLQSVHWYRPSLGFGHPFFAVFMKETRKRSLLGFISLGSRTSRWVERRATQEYAIGTIGVSEDGGVKFMSRVIGGTVGLATGLSMKVLTQAIGSAAVSSLGALAAPVAFLIGAFVLGSMLFSEKVTREVERTISGMDVFTGWRSAIGIREMRLAQRTYETGGEWISPVYRLSRPVGQLVLYAHDDVPEGCEIRYQLRAGSDWVDVNPHSQSGRVVNLDRATSEVQVRIQMKSNDETATPVVYGLMLEGYAR